MARPIRETPILFGEDARRFLARMQERHPESPEVRARRLRNYELMNGVWLKCEPAKLPMEVLIRASKKCKRCSV